MAESQLKRVSSKERAIVEGNIIAINAYRANRVLLTQRFAEGGYAIHETEHFLLFTREQAPSTIVAHWFAPEAIDANIGYYFIQELKPFGILECSEDFGNLFSATVGSLHPLEVRRAFRLYADNTIKRYRSILEGKSKAIAQLPIDDFATIYRRVLQLLVGHTVLDAGCSFGFLPVLIAEYVPSIKQIVGVDILDSFETIRTIARERNFSHVEFRYADLLHEDFSVSRQYDTILALHVLEHFTETEMYNVLVNLWKVTTRRMIIAVPYEPGQAETAHGHKQLLTSTKLEAIGQWCLEHLSDTISIWCEHFIGGLLIVDKQSSITPVNIVHQ